MRISLSPKPFLSGLIALVIALAGVGAFSPCVAEEDRPAVWAGKFYPSDPAELRKMITGYMEQATLEPSLAGRPGLRAVVTPHAGYIYSGPTAAYAAKALDGKRYARVILIGPDHRVGFSGCAITDKAAYTTPLGRVPVDKAAADLLRQDLFTTVEASDRSEHSLEVILPFLQQALGEFTLIPIVMSRADPNALAAALEPLLDDSTLLVVSTDLSHFLPYEDAVVRDRETLRLAQAFDYGALAGRENAACGIAPLLTLMKLAQAKGWEPITLKYMNSGDTAGDKTKVVGYAAMAWFAGQHGARPSLAAADGDYLLGLARTAIHSYVRDEKIVPVDLDACPAPLREKCGAFVTLTKGGALRGCIGSLVAEAPLVQSVRDNALRAAFSDPRFPPLKAEEERELEIEVSVLTVPAILNYEGAEDLLSKLRPGVDGVIIMDGPRQATFLPQVWDQLPDPREFLRHLCAKAAMAPDFWTRGTMTVYTYQVQSFHEGK